MTEPRGPSIREELFLLADATDKTALCMTTGC